MAIETATDLRSCQSECIRARTAFFEKRTTMSSNVILIAIVLAGIILAVGCGEIRYEAYKNNMCIELVSRRQSRYLPYVETYRVRKWGGLFNKIESKINYKIEYYQTWEPETRCCKGYRESGVVCEPICKPNCENGVCVGPNTCRCNNGYEKIDDSEYDCKPECTPNCTNGKCVQPNVCSCDSGFETHPENPFICVPKCENGCAFGTCVAPNNCTCDQGYAKSANGTCVPVCSKGCVMGECIAPESCSCKEGYGLLGTSRYICEPICEKICVNGTCTDPGVCTCSEGFVYHESNEEQHVCKPSCRIPCEPNGICAAPDRCDCFEGFRETGNRTDFEFNAKEKVSGCEPVCDQPCVNGNCTEPNVCSCSLGYRSTRNPYVCEPVCEPPCESNGICTAPNNCTCNLGHRLNQDSVPPYCEPVCELPCKENSTCTAPGVCTCDEGYANETEGRCVPICTSPCKNDTCVTPNTCECFDGFVPQNASDCVPFCENGCENGDCIAPNECRCHDGFAISVNDSSECVNECTRNCSGRGDCIGKEKPCDCAFGWTGWNCDEPTFCISMIPLDVANIDRITIRNATNGSKAYESSPPCNQCNDTLGNETLCYFVSANDSVPAAACFVSTDSSCYMQLRYNSAIDVPKLTGVLAAVTILVMAIAALLAYFLYCRNQRRKILSAIALQRETQSTETLLTEQEVDLH